MNAILTVSELTQSIRKMLEAEFRFVHLVGEISNLKTPYSGHCYFTLKDAGAQIRAVFFRQQQKFSGLTLQDGQQVIVFGRVSVYDPRGEYQFIVDSVELYGTGSLQVKFEALKKKLADKGYFTAKKKQLPAFPAKIAVISSPTGAAIRDFLHIVKMRRSPVHIQILPVKVQGKDAAGEIARAIRTAHTLADIDVVVLCRGGGSIEDLWAFNEEAVAEAIFYAKLPIVTGIGHEIDFTIADFCADYRCPTPTAAAEKLVPDCARLAQQLATLRNGLVLSLQRQLKGAEQRLDHHTRLLGEVRNIVKKSEFRLQLGESYLTRAISDWLMAKEQRLNALANTLQLHRPAARIDLYNKHLHMLVTQLNNEMTRIIEKKQASLSEQASLLNSVSPLATLGRGYAIVRKKAAGEEDYRVIARAADAELGDEVNILLHEGQLWCLVTGSK